MRGADEYYDLFNGKSEQIGRLYCLVHSHARGKCFDIFVLAEGVEAESNRNFRNGSVEVYGMTGGQRGWTETYGWLHDGKWQEDFKEILASKKSKREENSKRIQASVEKLAREDETKLQKALADY